MLNDKGNFVSQLSSLTDYYIQHYRDSKNLF